MSEKPQQLIEDAAANVFEPIVMVPDETPVISDAIESDRMLAQRVNEPENDQTGNRMLTLTNIRDRADAALRCDMSEIDIISQNAAYIYTLKAILIEAEDAINQRKPL